MKKVFFILFILVLAGVSSANILHISENHIYIDIKENGATSIKERYYLYFPTEENRNQVLKLNEDLGVELSKWNKENEMIKTHLGPAKNAKVIFVEDKENNLAYLELKYELKEPIVIKKNETTRNKTFYLNKKYFEGFKVGTVWVIPDNMAISIILPINATIKSKVQPQAEILMNGKRQEVLWKGYISTTELYLEYSVLKKINIDISQIVENYRKSKYFIPSLAVLAVLIIIGVIKRKDIEKKIEDFIIENSAFD